MSSKISTSINAREYSVVSWIHTKTPKHGFKNAIIALVSSCDSRWQQQNAVYHA